jgi:hypothetical protein
MSITVTFSLQDEEHILIVEPDDNFLDILMSTLGDFDNYTFSINGEKITPVSNLSKKLYNNIIIDVAPYTRGLANLFIDPREFPLEIKSLKNPNRPAMKIETVHISCSSDSFNSSKDMASFIV